MITKKYCYKNKTEECEEVYDLYDFPFDIIVNYCRKNHLKLIDIL